MTLKWIAAAALVGLAGCSTFSSSSSSSSDAGTATASGGSGMASAGRGGECDSAAAQGAVGKNLTQSLLDQTRSSAGAATARVLKPRELITMEYEPTRVNVLVDETNVVTAVRCG